MSGNILGYDLNGTTFAITSSNIEEVARFGSTSQKSQLRIYSSGATHDGYFLEAIQKPLAQDFAITRSQHATPSVYIQGASGRVGIGTSIPSQALSVVGNVYIDGEIIQKGSNQIIVSETVLSTSFYADYIYTSSNVDGIDFTNSLVKNIQSLQINDTLTVGGPMVHVMGSMQRFQVHTGQVNVTAAGTRRLGFTLSWTGTPGPVTAAHIFEVSGSIFMSNTAGTIRQHHKFTALVNPTDNSAATPSLPGLDVITDQQRMTSPAVGKTAVRIIRNDARSVRIFFEWVTVPTGYTANTKLDVFAPVALGTLTSTVFV